MPNKPDSLQTRQFYQQHPQARLIVLLLICLGSGLTSLSLSATLVAVPAIARDLNANALYTSWVAAFFLLSNLIVLLPAGRLADIYGRKRLTLLGLALFSLASLCAGFSPNIEFLLFCRILQGIGGGMFFSSSLAIVSSVYQDRGRGAAMGWVIAAVYLGLTGGPLFGGWITEHLSWRAVFLLMGPPTVLILLFALFKLKGEWRSQNSQAPDWPGAILFTLLSLAFFIAASSVPGPLSWLSGLLTLGLLWAFIHHCRAKAQPIVNLRVIWNNQLFSRSLLAAICMYAGNYGVLFLLGLYLQYNHGMTPGQAGQVLMLQALLMALVTPLSGRMSDRFPVRRLTAAGCLILALGLVILLGIDSHTPLWLTGLSLLLLGLGFGLFSAPNSNAAMGAVPEDKLGIASALLNLARLIGQLLGTVVVTLLMALLIGPVTLTATHFAALHESLYWTVLFALGCALVAAWYSLRRDAAAL